MRQPTCLLVPLMLLTTACATDTLIRQRADFPVVSERIQSIGILPVTAQVVRSYANGERESIDSEAALRSTELAEALGADVESWVMSKRIDEATLQAQPEILHDLRQLTDAAWEVVGKAYSPAYMSADAALAYQASLPPAPERLLQTLETDTLLIAFYRAKTKSKGRGILDFIQNSLPTPHLLQPHPSEALWVMLVDGHSGDVLWANAATREGFIGLTPDVKALADEALRPLIRHEPDPR